LPPVSRSIPPARHPAGNSSPPAELICLIL
jgi:hypothetical protein